MLADHGIGFINLILKMLVPAEKNLDTVPDTESIVHG